MLKMNSISLNAKSVINDKVVAYFTASVPEMGNPTMSKSIADRNAYIENKDECESDYSDFEVEVLKYIQEISTNIM